MSERLLRSLVMHLGLVLGLPGARNPIAVEQVLPARECRDRTGRAAYYYPVVCCMAEHSYVVYVRYSKLLEVHREVASRHPDAARELPPFPKKQMLLRGKSKVGERVETFDAYLKHLVTQPALVALASVRGALTYDPRSEVFRHWHCHMAGWILKRGHQRKNWRRRWFVLFGTELSYHEDSSRVAALDTANVSEVQVEYMVGSAGSMETGPLKLRLRLPNWPKRVLELDFARVSGTARRQWVRALEQGGRGALETEPLGWVRPDGTFFAGTDGPGQAAPGDVGPGQAAPEDGRDGGGGTAAGVGPSSGVVPVGRVRGELAGWLKVRLPGSEAWLRVWFVLRGTKLLYSTGGPEGDVDGTVELSGGELRVVPGPSGPSIGTLIVELVVPQWEGGRLELDLGEESIAQRSEWIAALESRTRGVGGLAASSGAEPPSGAPGRGASTGEPSTLPGPRSSLAGASTANGSVAGRATVSGVPEAGAIAAAGAVMPGSAEAVNPEPSSSEPGSPEPASVSSSPAQQP